MTDELWEFGYALRDLAASWLHQLAEWVEAPEPCTDVEPWEPPGWDDPEIVACVMTYGQLWELARHSARHGAVEADEERVADWALARLVLEEAGADAEKAGIEG